MKLNIYILISTILLLVISACETDNDTISTADQIIGCMDTSACNYEEYANIQDTCDYSCTGCMNDTAVNYDPSVTIDDGSCIILGCTDENATNYNTEATDDDNSCEYSVANLLNGDWNIVSLEYSTDVDLSDIPTVGPLIGVQTIAGEATNAGTWTFQYPEYLYNNNLNFTTDPITILTFEIPGFPIDVSSNGTWILTNNDNTIIAIDETTNLESSFEILNIQNNIAFIKGIIPFSQEIMGLNVDLDIEVEMRLEK
jgi:hypothetical protein